MTVLTYPCPSQPCFGGSKGCARVTGKAGENGQHSGEMGGSSPWTRPSAPRVWWHSRLQRATSLRSRVGIVLEDGSGVAIDWVPHGDGSMCSQANVRAGKVLRPPIRALPTVIVDTEKVLREADGPEEMWHHRRVSASGGKVFRPGVRLESRWWCRWGARRTQAVTNTGIAWYPTFITQSRLVLFQDSDFAGDLEDSKSTSGGTLCVSGSHTFVPISWMCKKQTSVSDSSTESEIISLDAGLRIRWFFCFRFMGSDCFCPWKHNSEP